MKNRPHKIDGEQVEIYRSVPINRKFHPNKGVKDLIVSGITNELKQSDIKNYFENYGKINNIDMVYDDHSCRIEFDE